MYEWWNSLSTFAQVLSCIALPSTLVLLIQTILMLIGIGSDNADVGDVDGDVGDIDTDITDSDGVFGEDVLEVDSDPTGLDGLRIFSVRGIIAFFVVFGWVGVALDEAGLKIPLNLVISAVCGIVVMFLVALLMRWVWRLQSDGTIDRRNAVGVSGSVYLTVPANREGVGKVNLTVQGSFIECEAVTDEAEPISTGKEIVVVGLSGQNTLVVRTK